MRGISDVRWPCGEFSLVCGTNDGGYSDRKRHGESVEPDDDRYNGSEQVSASNNSRLP